MRHSFHFQPQLREHDLLIAKAAMGDSEAVQKIPRNPAAIDAVGDHRLGALLAHRIHELGFPVQPEWHRALRNSAVTRLFLDEALKDLGTTLDERSIPWLPLKGMGRITEYYPRPECRPTSDLDILIPRERLDEARSALIDAGWIPIDDDEFEPGAIYNWKASHPSGCLLELHYTLWGGVDSRLAQTLLQSAEKSPELGASALHSSAPNLYIIGAAHLWNSPRPRTLLYFLDLHLLALDSTENKPTDLPKPDFAASVIQFARNHDLQLLVGLAAAITQALWPHSANAEIATALFDDLRLPERVLLRLSKNKPSADLHLGTITLARLLGRRKTRNGWNAVIRFLRRPKIHR